jgi:hypothetical protein
MVRTFLAAAGSSLAMEATAAAMRPASRDAMIT